MRVRPSLRAGLPANLRARLATKLRTGVPAGLRSSLSTSVRPSLPGGLRAGVLVFLIAAFFLPGAEEDPPEPRTVVWLERADSLAGTSENPAALAGADAVGAPSGTRAPNPAEDVVRSTLDHVLLAAERPGLVVRVSPLAPSAHELAGMDALARRVPLLVGLPGDPPPVRVSPPLDPRAGRAASITFAVHDEPGDTVPVRDRKSVV